MDEGVCTGLHPYGACAPGEGCNRERCGVFELGGPCDDERAPGFEVCRYHLRRELDAARARVAELEAEIREYVLAVESHNSRRLTAAWRQLCSTARPGALDAAPTPKADR